MERKMEAQFHVKNAVKRGEVVKRNPLTTWIRTTHTKFDVMSMKWLTEEKVIKRHNRKHCVIFLIERR